MRLLGMRNWYLPGWLGWMPQLRSSQVVSSSRSS
jgi:hypothetical protein